MILRTIISLLTLLFVAFVHGQIRTLAGKVISDEFYPLYLVSIFGADTTLLTKTDTSGNFSIAVTPDTKILLVADIGMEWKRIELAGDCSNLDIILQPAATYDFMSPAKVDRLRKKQFDKLAVVHKAAYENGIFNTERPCFIDRFVPYRNEKIKRHKAGKRMTCN